MAGRDVAKLLCDADAEELRDTRNAQLTTFVSSLMVLDAVERLGVEPSFCAGHSLGEYTALTATGALGFDDGVRLVAARAAAMHDAGNAQPGTMAAVLGLDDDQVEIACRRADADVWVANFNAPGQIVIAGSPDGRRGGRRPRQGARRQEGDAAPGVGRLPHPVHGSRRATVCGRRSPPANPRDTDVPVVSNVDAMASRPRRGLGQPALGAAVEPRALEALPARTRRRRRHEFRRTRPRRCAHRHGQADGHRLRARSRWPHRRTSTSSSNGSSPALASRRVRHSATADRGRAPVRGRAARRQPGLPASSRRSAASTTATQIAVGTVIGHVGELEVRSPFAGILQSYIAVDTERVTTRQPIAWLRST